MGIIDTHTHPAFSSEKFMSWAAERNIDFSIDGLLEEMKQNQIEKAFAFASYLPNIRLTNGEVSKIAEEHKEIVPVASIETYPPEDTLNEAAKQLIETLSTGAFKAVKIYTGYSDRYPTDPEYTKVFGICTNAKVPVIFHTGDTWWPEGPIETSHPFVFDGVAKNNPDTVFVLAHSGNPFFKEAAVVAYRNKNVYLDLACAIVEENPRKEDYLKNVAEGLTQGINYAGIGKFMHASDWPLVSMAEALKLTRAVIKAPEWELVIKETAKKVFRI